ncbi:MAG: hypothetical protein KF873_22870 [Gemmataceae bacterium]|nr:hypothetical protein [Gemmataceae bacterium]
MSTEKNETIRDSEFNEFRAPRTGDTTLTGRGKLLAEVVNDSESKSQKDNRYRRWWNMRVWETIGGKYVLHIAFRTQTKFEADHDTSQVFKSLAEALLFARENYEPTKYFKVPTPPETDPNSQKFTWIVSKLREEYKDTVNTLTTQAHRESGIGEQETEVE